MDKKTIIGLVLICLVFVVFGIMNRPTEEQKAAMRKQQDSALNAQIKANDKARQHDNKDSLSIDENDLVSLQKQAQGNDSLENALQEKINNKYSSFSACAIDSAKHIILENDVFKVDLQNKGGEVSQVILKNYKTYYKKPVTFFTNNGNNYGLNLSVGQVVVRTQDLFFKVFVNNKPYTSNKPIKVTGKDSVVISMRLIPNNPNGENNQAYYDNAKQYIEYKYILRGNDYRLGYNIVLNNMQDIIKDESTLEMIWNSELKLKEKDAEIERKNSSVYYLLNDEVDYLKENGRDDSKTESGIPIKWISYKQQFFSTALMAKKTPFTSATMVDTTEKKADNSYVRTMTSSLSLPYQNDKQYTEYAMNFFYGPNKYSLVKDYDISMEQIIPLGWGFFLLQWLNRFVIIPVFDFLSGFDLSMGIIILILTILVKIVLFPLAYKSFASTAKMKIIQPEVDKINEKYPKQDQAMQKQQAMMGLYKRAGINPMAGCLPMLLQFPILVAMFRFFPSSIELRQQSFLWADDLSTYDSIVNMPFNIPFYGNHVSLFCLLMTVAQLIYTKWTMTQQSQNNSVPGMKFMMYLMPIFMLFMLNSFSAALNYYYFISLLFSIIQMWVIRKSINEQKVLDTLEKNSKKPLKKSKWQQRMEALEKQNKQLVAQRSKKK
ncbi:MAG: membrane protein insertase YidC [Bacteroidales bacterium]|jgi:YidC/Oxa1 family membrane protein insertase|nr:membrane protein insertase YidC [Bacteroidales bacterium]